ncbi:MAG: leucine-rich repeat domain-containing protein, partial [Intestinibacter sp.]
FMYLRETVRKPISVMLTIMMILAYMLPYQLSYAEEIAYGFQGLGGNTMKMLSYEGDITVEEQTSEKYVNAIGSQINGSEDVVFGFTMTAGMNAFGDGTNFKANCMPYIKIYDSDWKDVVAEYDGGNGLLKYMSYDSSTRTIYIGVEKDILAAGDYILVFGPEVCGNNVAKKLGVPVAFKFTTYGGFTGEVDKTEINNLIAEIEKFISEATIGTEIGQYPSKEDIETAISDAKKVSENVDASRKEVKEAIESLTNAFEAFKDSRVISISSVAITSDKEESVQVGATGTATASVTAQPDEDQYKEVEFTASDNISIDSKTGKWQALYAGDAYIKATSTKDAEKYDTYNFKVVDAEDMITVTIAKGSTLQATVDKLLASTGKSYEDVKGIKVITSEGVDFTSADCTFINTNLTAAEKIDLSLVTVSGSFPSVAFMNNTTIKEVVLPDDVQYIGYGTFDGCTSLEKANIPNKAVSIPAYFFRGCTNLKDVEIPANITSISLEAFKGCTSLGTT